MQNEKLKVEKAFLFFQVQQTRVPTNLLVCLNKNCVVCENKSITKQKANEGTT
ncbi:hypothetical protein LguiA_008205 [Lonicera macranthoides]